MTQQACMMFSKCTNLSLVTKTDFLPFLPCQTSFRRDQRSKSLPPRNVRNQHSISQYPTKRFGLSQFNAVCDVGVKRGVRGAKPKTTLKEKTLIKRVSIFILFSSYHKEELSRKGLHITTQEPTLHSLPHAPGHNLT